MKGAGPVRIGDVLKDVLRDAGVEEQVRRMGVLELWPELVGESIAEVTAARAVSDATLFVEVQSSPWLMELNMMKGEILERVNARFRDTPLKRIVFVLAETE